MNPTWKALGKSEQMLYILTAVVAISLFLPWRSYSILGIGGWNNGFSGWGMLTAFGVVAEVFALTSRRSSYKIGGAEVSSLQLRIAGGALMFIGSALYLAIGAGSYQSNLVAASFGPSYGVYIAFLAGLAILLIALKEFRKPNES